MRATDLSMTPDPHPAASRAQRASSFAQRRRRVRARAPGLSARGDRVAARRRPARRARPGRGHRQADERAARCGPSRDRGRAARRDARDPQLHAAARASARRAQPSSCRWRTRASMPSPSAPPFTGLTNAPPGPRSGACCALPGVLGLLGNAFDISATVGGQRARDPRATRDPATRPLALGGGSARGLRRGRGPRVPARAAHRPREPARPGELAQQPRDDARRANASRSSRASIGCGSRSPSWSGAPRRCCRGCARARRCRQPR